MSPRGRGRAVGTSPDWRRLAALFLLSRGLDELEEQRLLPSGRLAFQFSARGHELGQLLLAAQLTGAHDAVCAYYRSRPLMLSLGLSPADALAGGLAKAGGMSDGRDTGTVYNLFSNATLPASPIVLPMAGGVGTQFGTAAGWARAIVYWRDVLGEASYRGAIAVALGGEASVASGGFWSALALATTQRLPLLFFIEDNGYGISVPGTLQTPGGDIASNLTSFQGLRLWDGDGTEPASASRMLSAAVAHVRSDQGPALVRLIVPRLSGHSGQDNQAYKSRRVLEAERKRDPLPRLRRYLVPRLLSETEWRTIEYDAEASLARALAEAESRPQPDPRRVREHVFAPPPPTPRSPPQPEGPRLNFVAAVRRTLAAELAHNPKVLIFGEDVGKKGGVHTATDGLQAAYGPGRVFDTSLSEEGIIGTAVGLALAGLRPVAEIQFRKYAEPASEALDDCGTLRWRTANRFSAPIVVRVPGGFAKVGDPWHSCSSEVTWTHLTGWQVLFPSNAEDAVGLLRTALRSPNPSFFFEHRTLLDSAAARRPYPGDDFQLPLGQAACVQAGSDLTVITWGAMVERCQQASRALPDRIEILDLRTLAPWDRETVLDSVRRTSRALIVHEDTRTAGFGAEIAAVLAEEAFLALDAPITRLAVPDIPLPYNRGLLDAVLPSVDAIAAAMQRLLAF